MVFKVKNVASLSAFEASRKEARMCRQEFEQVKKRRYDLFSQCFEHVSVSIDQIYKKLCRNVSAQVGISTPNAAGNRVGGRFFLVGSKYPPRCLSDPLPVDSRRLVAIVTAF